MDGLNVLSHASSDFKSEQKYRSKESSERREELGIGKKYLIKLIVVKLPWKRVIMQVHLYKRVIQLQ